MNHTYTFTGRTFAGIPAVITFEYLPGDPGYYSGLPEDCYPGQEEEIDITSVTVAGGDILDLESIPVNSSRGRRRSIFYEDQCREELKGESPLSFHPQEPEEAFGTE